MASSYSVPLACIAVAGLAEVDSVSSGGGFVMRPVIGSFILGVFLYAVGEASPKLSAAFAVLVVVNAVIEHGRVFDKLAGAKPAVAKGKKL